MVIFPCYPTCIFMVMFPCYYMGILVTMFPCYPKCIFISMFPFTLWVFSWLCFHVTLSLFLSVCFNVRPDSCFTFPLVLFGLSTFPYPYFDVEQCFEFSKASPLYSMWNVFCCIINVLFFQFISFMVMSLWFWSPSRQTQGQQLHQVFNRQASVLEYCSIQ